MKTAAELIDDASTALGEMRGKAQAIHDYASMLGVLRSGHNAENALEGVYRVVLEIRSLADDVRTYHDDAKQAVQRLAKP
jgi:hypothetical protein